MIADRARRGLAVVAVAALLLVPYALLAVIFPARTFYALSLVAGVVAAYGGWTYYVVEHRPALATVFSARGLFVALVLAVVLAFALGWLPATPLALVHLFAIAIVFGYLVVVAVAVYDDLAADVPDAGPPYPSVTVVVPAYNEEGYVGPTVESILAADYPEMKRRVVVVDDGSTDDTYREAAQYAAGTVRVVQKENGGKYSALNYGLLFADDDLIVTVDADSRLSSDALKKLVAPFQADSSIGAVAGNVKVTNRDSVLTRCQSLEYVFGINVYRRFFDHLGIVPIVPGCLGAYRRDVLETIDAYDPQTLTEDFDATIQVLLAGYAVRAADATVYTEAPATWRDLYKQRLRWYRGNFMTLFRHWERLCRPERGYLHRVFLPVRLVEMFVVPFASVIVLGVVGGLVLVGSATEVGLLFAVFTSVVVLINALAVVLEGEDLRHVVYSPLFVVGYKHVHDLLTIQSLFDVLTSRELSWTRAERVKQREVPSTEREAASGEQQVASGE